MSLLYSSGASADRVAGTGRPERRGGTREPTPDRSGPTPAEPRQPRAHAAQPPAPGSPAASATNGHYSGRWWQLTSAEGIRNDPVAQASLRTLALACQVATDQNAEASRSFASLVALIERQPDDFHLVWDWTSLRKLLAESKVPTLPARRESLNKLIDAVNRDNKAAILAGLEEAQGAFTGRE
jgi:hypothetical protein